MKLSYVMRARLKDLDRDGQEAVSASIIHPTYSALEKRGLVKWVSDSERAQRGLWQITKAGREALSS